MVQNTFSAEIDSSKMGPPGFEGILVLSPGTANDNDQTHRARITDNSVRPFEVKAYFSKTIKWDSNIDVSPAPDNCGSFLLLGSNVLHMKMRGPHNSEFIINKNGRHEICSVEALFMADSAKIARNAFLDFIHPLIDFWSFKFDLPIYVEKVGTKDIKNSVITIDFIGPYKNLLVEDDGVNSAIALGPILALYREAKTNQSPFYRFLCYYKIMEGIFSKLRPEIYLEFKKLGQEPPKFKEVIPEDEELRRYYSTYIGQPIQKFFNEYLNPEYRNAVAHFNPRDGVILNLSESKNIVKYNNIIYVSQVCARTVIQNVSMLLDEFQKHIPAQPN